MKSVNDIHFLGRYSDLESKTKNLRGSVRGRLLDALQYTQSALENNCPRVQILYFHHIFQDEEASFRDLIETLSGNYSFISYSEAIRRIRINSIDKRYLAFSSDDGLANNLIAAKVLQEFGVSACFFLNPRSLSLSDTELPRFCRERLNLPPVRFLSWRQVEFLQNEGHEIGSHSNAHLDLGLISTEEVSEEIHRAHTILSEKCGTPEHFAVPYGRWYNFPKVGIDFLNELNYHSCATAIRGCHVPKENQSVDSETITVFRDLLIAKWPPGHLKFFLAFNSRFRQFSNHDWKQTDEKCFN